MQRSELCVPVPLCVPLPLELLCPDLAFPFLDLTLTDLGVDLASVRERVVWADSKRTRRRTASGKVREREALVLEVRVTAQRPGPGGQTQEILYGTETHSERRYCKTMMEVHPWIKSEGEKQEEKPEFQFSQSLQLRWFLLSTQRHAQSGRKLKRNTMFKKKIWI
ncbi:uncharacterized protein si:ch211-196f5.2 isoform X3 [Acipenser ruthenus]|nr:uncharacterized protein si:ch211-196f5.2 isoform X3 [Acipenser ruthenus]